MDGSGVQEAGLATEIVPVSCIYECIAQGAPKCPVWCIPCPSSPWSEDFAKCPFIPSLLPSHSPIVVQLSYCLRVTQYEYLTSSAFGCRYFFTSLAHLSRLALSCLCRLALALSDANGTLAQKSGNLNT
jgi:hypothetical protein